MPRIIFVNRYFYPDHSATSQMLSDLAFFISESGVEVCVVTSRQLYDASNALLASRETVRGLQIFRVRTSRFGRDKFVGRAVDYATFYVAAGWRILRIARAGDVIVAKTDPPLISVVATFIAQLRSAHLVNWLQDVFPEVAESLGVRALTGPRAGLLRRLRERGLRRAAANVVLSESMAAVVVRAGGPPSSIHVIPNWADMAAISPIAAVGNPLRREWGLTGKFVVCYSGNMGRVHEFRTMIDAARVLSMKEEAVEFVFIGGGAQRRMVEEQVHTMGLKNMQFRPYQDRESLSLSLGVGDVHLVSQRPEVEGFVYPSKLYGILAAGRPVVFIGERRGEIGVLVEREGIGVAVEQGDAAGLADQLIRLSRDTVLREAMGRRARTLLCERYDKRIAFKAWEKLLEDVGS